MSYRNGFLAAALVGMSVWAVAAEPDVTVDRARYPRTLNSSVGGKPVKMVLTGAAMRTKYTFKVYSIGSYVQEKVAVRNASELVGRGCSQTTLPCLPNARRWRFTLGIVPGLDRNDPSCPGLRGRTGYAHSLLKAHPVKVGSRIWLSHIPGEGLGCQVAGAPGIKIPNVELAQTVWEVYLGRKNLGVAIQTGLTSHLHGKR